MSENGDGKHGEEEKTEKRSIRSKIFFHLKKIHNIDKGKEKSKSKISSGLKHMGKKCESCGEIILTSFRKHKIACKQRRWLRLADLSEN